MERPGQGRELTRPAIIANDHRRAERQQLRSAGGRQHRRGREASVPATHSAVRRGRRRCRRGGPSARAPPAANSVCFHLVQSCTAWHPVVSAAARPGAQAGQGAVTADQFCPAPVADAWPMRLPAPPPAQGSARGPTLLSQPGTFSGGAGVARVRTECLYRCLA